MRNRLLQLFCIGIVCIQGVLGSPNREPDDDLIKQGTFPYMGFIYYMDKSIVDASGARFMRSAVLIRSDWLVTSALGPSVSDGFPKKTLLARFGAVSVDQHFTLNEDSGEQEREVILIVRPYNHSATQWWTTDISLTKTLLPFTMSSSVGVIDITNKRVPDTWKTCNILVYTKTSNDTKTLVQMYVDILPPADNSKCGTLFTAETMVCGFDSAVYETTPYSDSNFCQGNSGGPLIHESEVVGLQTYVDNNCKPPHLYQLFTSWDNFITCSIENKCLEKQCENICDVTYKDPPKTNVSTVETTNSTNTTLTQTSTIIESKTTEEEKENSTLSSSTEMKVEPTTSITTASRKTTSSESTIATSPYDPDTATTLDTTENPSPELTSHYNNWPRTDEKSDLIEEEETPRRVRVMAQHTQSASNARVKCLLQTLILILVLLFVMN